MKNLIYLCIFLLFSSKSFAQTITVSGASDPAVNHAFVFDISHHHYHYLDNALKDYFFNPEVNKWVIYGFCNGCSTPQSLYSITIMGANNPPCAGSWTKSEGSPPVVEALTVTGACFQTNQRKSLFMGQDYVGIPQSTTTQITTIANPPTGALAYDVNNLNLQLYRNSAWEAVTTSSNNFWVKNGTKGNEIKSTNTEGFWSGNDYGLSGLSTDLSNIPTAPVNGVGTRLMWIPSRSAFRVGSIANFDNPPPLQWDASNIGLFSFASGFNTTASGKLSNAIGSNTIASGINSTAMGNTTTASGDYSTAMGNTTIASGINSTAMGTKVNTNSFSGAFIIGDSDPLSLGATLSGSADQFVARFKNGYFLITSGNTSRTGVQIANGQTSWSAISDSTRKEKFIKANGEDFLVKLRQLRLGSWNYKNQKPNPERFYGPMAQEIFAAYGKDAIGIIGCDTLVSTLNMDGLLFIFAQTLEKRTRELQEENMEIKSQLIDLQRVVIRINAIEVLLDNKKIVLNK